MAENNKKGGAGKFMLGAALGAIAGLFAGKCVSKKLEEDGEEIDDRIDDIEEALNVKLIVCDYTGDDLIDVINANCKED